MLQVEPKRIISNREETVSVSPYIEYKNVIHSMDHCIYNDIIFMQEISQFIESLCTNVLYNGVALIRGVALC